MASYPLTWLADVLRAAGCRVIEEDGWRTRGREGSFAPKAIMLHHDASPAGETSGGVDVIRDGRPGLAGPLAQLWLSFDGVWHVVAAGRANHAGEGRAWGVVATDQGNRDAIGIETDHTTDELWSSSQRSEGIRGVAALCEHLGITTRAEIDKALCAHKEYAPDRKVDPDPLDMDQARANLADFIATGGGTPVRTIQKACSTPRTIEGAGNWRDLQFDDDEDVAGGPFVLVGGPVDWYAITVQAYLSGPPGTRFQLRPYRTSNGHTDQYKFAVRDYEIPSDGTVGVELTQQGGLSDGWYYRVQGVSLGPDLVVTKAWAEIATW